MLTWYGANHSLSNLAQGGHPQPCAKPLTLQRKVSSHTFPVNPITMFIIPVNNIPVVNIILGLKESDKRPPLNFPIPYMAAKPLVITPSSFFFMFSSLMRAGTTKVYDFLQK